MATKVYFRTAQSGDVHKYTALDTGATIAAWKKLDGTNVSAWVKETLLDSAGPVAINRSITTVAGPTSGIEINNSSTSLPYHFISPPLAADVTISGTITLNIWANESSMSANAAVNVIIERIDSTGAIASTIAQTTRTTELGTSFAAENFTVTPTSTNMLKGDRIRARIYGDDAGTMGSSFNMSVSYDGPTTGAQGDTYISFNETITFQTTTPSGTTVYLTNTASTVSTAANDLEAWKTAGSSTATAVTNTVAGPTGNIQVTDTAGGTVIDWWTKPLAAMTLGSGPVAVTLATQESNTLTFGAMGIEIARVDNDGTNATVWGKNMSNVTGTTVGDTTFWVSGDDLSISDGQRLRIRAFIDDNLNSASLVAGRTITLSYNGSAGSSTDAFLIFTDTLNLAPSQQFGQTQARIKQTYKDNPAQAQADIKATSRGVAQTNAVITRGGDTKVIDTFTRSVTDGLGTADTGGAWTFISGTAANADVNGSAATFQMSTSTQYISNLKDVLISPANEGVSIRFRTQFSILPTADQNFIYIAGLLGSSESADTGTGILVWYKQSTDRLVITVANGNSALDLSGTTGAYFQTPDINVNYWVEVTISPTSTSNTRVRAKMYQDGTIGGNYTDDVAGVNFGNPRPGHAGVTVYTKASSPPVITLDSLEIQKAGWTVSGQAMARIQGRVYAQTQALIGGTSTSVVDTFTRSVTDGWGTADTGGAYTLETGTIANFDVTGSIGTIQSVLANAQYITLKTVTVNNTSKGYSTRFKFKVSAQPSQSEVIMQIVATGSSGTLSNYSLQGGTFVQVTYISGTNSFRLSAGNETGTTSLSGTDQTFIADTFFVVEVTHTLSSNNKLRIRGKLYQDGTTPNAYVFNSSSGLSFSTFAPSHISLGPASIAGPNTPLISLDDIEIIDASWTESGQAQAQIVSAGVTTNRGHAQAQADIKQTYTDKSGQAQADIKQTYTDKSGQTQADIKATNRGLAQANADIKNSATNYTTPYGQANADIKNSATSFTTPYGQAQADIKATNRGYAQAQSDIKQVGFGLAQAQADIKNTYFGLGQAQADIKATSFGLAQANADIKNSATSFTTPYGQAQADIKQTSSGYAQSQADIKAVGNGFGQAQATIRGNVFAQAQADIKQTYFGLGQAQADIKATNNGSGQAQASIAKTNFGLGQAQADIKQTYFALGQAQADIKNTYFTPAQAQADIKNTYYALGQAQATIRGNVFAQAQADIKQTYFGLGQSQADIKNTYVGLGQAQADIKATNNGFGQAQGDIKTIYYALGQAQADIRTTYFVVAQANADIKATATNYGSPYAQAQADIKATNNGFGQAQADIKQTYFGLAQAQADINNTYFALAQAQANIKQTYFVVAQAQADIKQTYNAFAQAQANIKNTYFALGQAQGAIGTASYQSGQCQAFLYVPQVAHPDEDISVTGWVRTVI